MWEALKDVAHNMNGAWLLAGDFNDIISPMEKKGGGPPNFSKMKNFADRISNSRCNLMDLGAVGTKFTWHGALYYDGNHIFKRFGRALCNDEWRLRFDEAFVRVLPRVEYSVLGPSSFYYCA